jgi:hypothetical protein
MLASAYCCQLNTDVLHMCLRCCRVLSAGGIVVFDLRTKLFKWQQHLDQTTATTKFTAHMFSSPTLVDLDADGKMEIIVGTSVGFVYVLDHKVSLAVCCLCCSNGCCTAVRAVRAGFWVCPEPQRHSHFSCSIKQDHGAPTPAQQ